MYHIPNRHTCGLVQIQKSTMGDIMELIRLRPNAARTLLCILNYADRDNELICDLKTLGHSLGMHSEEVAEELYYLRDNAYIDADKIRIADRHRIRYIAHNYDLYMHYKNKIWEHVDDELVKSYKKHKTFMRIKLNHELFQSSNNMKLGILMLFGRQKLYDTRNDEVE